MYARNASHLPPSPNALYLHTETIVKKIKKFQNSTSQTKKGDSCWIQHITSASQRSSWQVIQDKALCTGIILSIAAVKLYFSLQPLHVPGDVQVSIKHTKAFPMHRYTASQSLKFYWANDEVLSTQWFATAVTVTQEGRETWSHFGFQHRPRFYLLKKKKGTAASLKMSIGKKV